MADRSTFNGASTNVPWQDTAEAPEGFGNQYARHIKALYDASALPLTSVGGTGDNVTAVVDPSLPPGGLRDGMKFGVTWAAANTGPMTLTITGAGAAPVLSADGSVAAPGLAALGGRALLEYVGGAFRVLSGGAGSGSTARYYWQFTASGTWIKPAGPADNAIVTVEMWGGGGSGGLRASASDRPGGGGGGGYLRLTFRFADLPAVVPVVVGAGGAGATSGNVMGKAGGTSSFGVWQVFGGGGGHDDATAARWAGGGGEFGVGGIGVAGSVSGGSGASGSAAGGGGGAGAIAGTVPIDGGKAVHGGGGGANGWPGAAGGISLHGGNGGAANEAGSAPGGGGGGGGIVGGGGARGEVRIWI